jgi:predicted RNA binding protein YcfA (HicA-like mRNA interferase family)
MLAAMESEATVPLPDSPWRYFIKTPTTVLVSLKKCTGQPPYDRTCMTPIRARVTGIAHANQYMRAAYDGTGKKRKPISVRWNIDGSFTVLDGNSTFANALANHWKKIPVEIDEPVARKQTSEELRSELRRLRSFSSPFPQVRARRIAETRAALREMKERELRAQLRRDGCVELRQKGSHLQVQCGKCQTTIPIHKGHDIKRGTLGAIERSLGSCIGHDLD